MPRALRDELGRELGVALRDEPGRELGVGREMLRGFWDEPSKGAEVSLAVLPRLMTLLLAAGGIGLGVTEVPGMLFVAGMVPTGKRRLPVAGVG